MACGFEFVVFLGLYALSCIDVVCCCGVGVLLPAGLSNVLSDSGFHSLCSSTVSLLLCVLAVCYCCVLCCIMQVWACLCVWWLEHPFCCILVVSCCCGLHSIAVDWCIV